MPTSTWCSLVGVPPAENVRRQIGPVGTLLMHGGANSVTTGRPLEAAVPGARLR
jgi:hypothetical protein